MLTISEGYNFYTFHVFFEIGCTTFVKRVNSRGLRALYPGVYWPQ